MDAALFTEIQEGLLFVFGPILFWWFVFIGVTALLSAIGVVLMSDLPTLDSMSLPHLDPF